MLDFMDINFPEIVKIGIYSTTALGIAHILAKNFYLTQKEKYFSNPETIKALENLMNSEGFKDYTGKRKDLTEKIVKDHFRNDNYGAHISSLVNNTLEEFIIPNR